MAKTALAPDILS